jgi:hypothetical protein
MDCIRRPAMTGLFVTALIAGGAARPPQNLSPDYFSQKEKIDRAEKRFYAEKNAALALAKHIDLPIRYEDLASSKTFEIMRLSPDGRPIYYETRNRDAGLTIKIPSLYVGGNSGAAMDGSGTSYGIWDAGVVRSAHVEFEGRATYLDAAPLNNHATHVAGTLIAGGVGSPFGIPGAAKGMAFKGALRSHDWNNDDAEIRSEIGTSLTKVTVHGYGPTTGWAFGDFGAGTNWYWFGNPADSAVEDSSFGRYDDEAAKFDDIASDFTNSWAPALAAGNDRGEGPTSQPTGFFWNGANWVPNAVVRNVDGGASGYDTVSGAAVGKNMLAVGAVEEVFSYTGPASVVLAPFSACGPTDDGRIKPDVVANGTSIISASAGTNTSYLTMDGTSSAAATVAAAGGMLRTFRPRINDASTFNRMRQLLIHTARECGPNPGPDYQFGWGLVDVEAAAKVANDNEATASHTIGWVTNGSLATGASRKFLITSNGTKPLRVSIGWGEPAATAINSGLDPATHAVIDDADVTVRRIGGETTNEWVLDPANPSAPATKGDNDRDNIKVVDVPNPPAGLYEITVSADGVVAANPGINFRMIVTGLGPPTPNFTHIDLYGSYITGTNSTNARIQVVSTQDENVYTVVEPAGVVKITNPIVVPASTTLKTFPIVGAGDVAVNTPFTVKFYCGFSVSQISGILIPLRISSLTLTPDPVQSGDSIDMTIKMNGPAPPGGKVITIDRSPTYWVMAPPSVTIPQGQSQITVSIPIRAGAPAISNARLTATQGILPSGTYSVSKLFDITP